MSISSSSKTSYLVILSALLLTGPAACFPNDENNNLGASATVPPEAALLRTYSADVSASKGGARVGVVQQAVNGGHGIVYGLGHVMSGVVHMYYIWYGNWSNNSAQTILSDFGNNISNSPYYNINTLYDDAYGGVVSGAVQLAGVTTDNGTQGVNLTSSGVWAVVVSAIQQGRLPDDPNGVYFVFTSADVGQVSDNGQQRFCVDYCGWHSYNTYSGNNLKYAFVGDGDRCPAACRPFPGPNGNAGADGMVSVVAHELEETVTDPQLSTWVNPPLEENADLCAWTFGASYPANGAMANMRLGSRDYYIQQNWINSGSGSCGLKLPFPTATDCLFNWAEANYTTLFAPAGAITTVVGDYELRYYSGTQSYLGISFIDQHVYYLGPNGLLQDLGPKADWLTTSNCQIH